MKAIAYYQPKEIFIIADGPPVGADPALEANCLAARKEAESGVMWEANVRTNYAPENMGLRRRLETGLDWVFSEVPFAMILEEDCHPEPDFFSFVEAMRGRYENEEKIGCISGNCFLPSDFSLESSYFFSRYPQIWGWATWARAWKAYDNSSKEWPRAGGIYALWPDMSRREVRYWKRVLDRVYQGELSTWDYRWLMGLWSHRLLSITPAINLVKNAGFGEGATNTKDPGIQPGIERVGSLHSPYAAPNCLVRNVAADEAVFRRLFRLDLDAVAMRSAILERGPELAPYMEAIPGLRSVRPSSRVEAFVTFLCTPNNNLSRILPMAWHLGSLGPVITNFDGLELHAFPSLDVVAGLSDEQLRAKGFGYRARTIPEIARDVVGRGGEKYLDDLANSDYHKAMAELITIKGIGPKLADCICLFSLHHMEAAPIDTHLWQAVVRHYFPQWSEEKLTGKKYVEIGDFLRGRFGDLTGWAHQYLFYDNVLNWRDRKVVSGIKNRSRKAV